MGLTDPAFETSAETYQDGVTPVQAFTSLAIPVPPGATLAPRLGRPIRSGSPAGPNGAGVGAGPIPDRRGAGG